MIQVRSFFVALTISAFVASCGPDDENGGITAEQARAIADQVLVSAEFDVPDTAFVKLYITPDNRCLQFQFPTPDQMAEADETRKILSGHDYYLVMYEIPNLVFGFIPCVFIDKNDGKVLAIRLF